MRFTVPRALPWASISCPYRASVRGPSRTPHGPREACQFGVHRCSRKQSHEAWIRAERFDVRLRNSRNVAPFSDWSTPHPPVLGDGATFDDGPRLAGQVWPRVQPRTVQAVRLGHIRPLHLLGVHVCPSYQLRVSSLEFPVSGFGSLITHH
jgi:hypothetical protein